MTNSIPNISIFKLLNQFLHVLLGKHIDFIESIGNATHLIFLLKYQIRLHMRFKNYFNRLEIIYII